MTTLYTRTLLLVAALSSVCALVFSGLALSALRADATPPNCVRGFAPLPNAAVLVPVLICANPNPKGVAPNAYSQAA